MPSSSPTKILILGGGFGGVHTFLHLQKLLKNKRNIEITLISKTNSFTFVPMLHEVATAYITPDHILEPLPALSTHKKAQFIEAEVEAVATKKRIVQTTAGNFEYDYLVIALGSTNNFYNISGAKEHCFTLKTLEDAIKIKHHLLSLAEKASRSKKKKEWEELLRIAIIGGGPTGVELAAETSDFFFHTLQKYFPKSHIEKNLEILLIEQAPHILSGFSENVRDKTLEILKEKKIQLLCNTTVQKVEKNRIYTSQGTIATDTIVWTAGIKPVGIKIDSKSVDKRGCFLVDDTMLLQNSQNIFVIGDSALCMDKKTQAPVPHLAQSAIGQAKIAAENIVASLENKALVSFQYRPLGQFVALGEMEAVGEVCRYSFSGKVGGWLWHAIHVAKLLSWKKRIKVALDLIINSTSSRDISKL